MSASVSDRPSVDKVVPPPSINPPPGRSKRPERGILTLRGNKEPYGVRKEDLADASCVLAYCRSAAEQNLQVEVALRSGEQLLDPAVRCLLLNIQDVDGLKVRYSVGKHKDAKLLSALLELPVDPKDVSQCEQHLNAAIEVAASVHRESLDLACGLIVDSLRAQGIKGIRIRDVQRKAVSLTGGKSRQHVTARQAASLYMEHLRAAHNLEGDAPCVLYQDEEFAVYEGTHWSLISSDEMQAAVTKFLQDDLDRDVTKSILQDVLINLKGLSFLPNKLPGQVLYLESLHPLQVRPTFAISVKNGLLVPAQGGHNDGRLELIPHDPRYLVRSCLPFEFDPDAECPLWQETLDEVLPRSEAGDFRQEVLQELMGLSLMPQAARLETAGILVGSGANGKSTVLSVLESILGPDYTAHIPLDQLGGPFRLNELRGKHANIASDMNRMDRVEEGLLKQIISGDPISVNRKFLSPITLRMFCVFLFATNELPQFLDPTKGIWRRLRIIPFLENFDEANRDIHRIEKLQAELPGILNALLKALQRLLAENSFSNCTVCERALSEHRLRSDPVLSFLDEYTTSDPKENVDCQQLYLAYREYCELNGRRPLSHGEFGSRLPERKIKVVRPRQPGSRPRHYQGISLLPPGHELAGNQKMKKKLT